MVQQRTFLELYPGCTCESHSSFLRNPDVKGQRENTSTEGSDTISRFVKLDASNAPITATGNNLIYGDLARRQNVMLIVGLTQG